MPKQLKGDLLLLLVTLIWGGTFPLVKGALSGIGPFSLVALRFSIGFLTLALLCRLTGARIERRALGAGVLLGILLFGGYGLQTLGLVQTTAAKSGFITGLSVPLASIISVAVLRERPGARVIVGVVISTLGLALLSLRGDLTMSYGDLLTLGCAFFWAFHVVATGRFAPVQRLLPLVTVQLGVTALLSWPVALATERPFAVSTDALLATVFLGLVATAACFSLQTHAQSFTSATHTALVLAMEPVFAGLFSVLLLAEVLGLRAVTGCALILAGMVFAELRAGRRPRTMPPAMEMEM